MIYFAILDFLRERKKIDPTRWFTKKEIEIALEREEDFSERCLKKQLRRLRRYHKVWATRMPKESETKIAFIGKGVFLYKSREDISPITEESMLKEEI